MSLFLNYLEIWIYNQFDKYKFRSKNQTKRIYHSCVEIIWIKKSLRCHFHFVFNFSTGCFLPWTNTKNAQNAIVEKKRGKNLKQDCKTLFQWIYLQFFLCNWELQMEILYYECATTVTVLVCDGFQRLAFMYKCTLNMAVTESHSGAYTDVGIQICPGTIQRHRRGQVRMHTAEATKPVANNSRYHRTKTVRCVHCLWTNKYLWPTCNFGFMFNYKSSGFKASVCLRLRNYGKS